MWAVLVHLFLLQDVEEYEWHQNGGSVSLDVFLQILLRLRAQES